MTREGADEIGSTQDFLTFSPNEIRICSGSGRSLYYRLDPWLGKIVDNYRSEILKSEAGLVVEAGKPKGWMVERRYTNSMFFKLF
jgi:hypothetical protein